MKNRLNFSAWQVLLAVLFAIGLSERLSAQTCGVSINSNPISHPDIDAVILCDDLEQVVLTANNPSMASISNYKWDKLSPGMSNIPGNVEEITILRPSNGWTSAEYGKYRLEVMGQLNNESCTNTTFIDLVPPLVSDILPSSQTLCTGSTLNVSFSTPIGTDPQFNFLSSGQRSAYQSAITYTWTLSGSNIGIGNSGTGNINTTVTSTGTATITVTPVIDGCEGKSKSFTVTVTAVPTITVTNPALSFCSGGTSSFNYSTTGNPNQFMVTSSNFLNTNGWVNLPAPNGSFPITVPANTPPGVYTGMVSVRSAAAPNCVGQPISISVTVFDAPPASITANPTAICPNGTATLTATGGGTYMWSNGQTTSSITVNTPTTYTVTVTGTNTCTKTATLTLGTSPVPGPISANPAGPISVCVGEFIPAITFTSSGATQISWQMAGGLNFTGTGNIPANLYKPTTTGTTTVTVTSTNGTCAVGSPLTFTINAVSAPTVQAVSNVTGCSGDAISVNFSGTANTYNWVNSNPGSCLGASGTGNIAVNCTVSSTPSVSNITVTPANSATCIGSPVSFSITVNPKPSGTLTLSESSGTVNDGTVCEGGQFSLIGDGGTSCTWTAPPGAPAAPSGCNWGPLSIPNSGVFTVAVTNSFGCSATATRSVSIQPNPDLDIAVSSPCEGQTLTLTVPQGFNSYIWTTPTGVLPPSSNTYSKTNAGAQDEGTYSVKVKDNVGCEWVSSKSVSIDAKPTPQLSSEFLQVCTNGQGYYRVVNPTSASESRFQWTITPAVSSADTANYGSLIFVQWRTPGTYTIQVKEVLGANFNTPCAGSISTTVEVSGTGNNVAPNAETIGYYAPNNILIYPDSAQCYQWGYFQAPNTLTYIQGETYQAYGAGESYDPNRVYFVKTWLGNCAAESCPTVQFRTQPIAHLNTPAQPELRLYPNPNNGQFLFEGQGLPPGDYDLVLTDVLGRPMGTLNASADVADHLAIPVQMDGKPSGLYCAVLLRNGKRLMTKTFLVHAQN